MLSDPLFACAQSAGLSCNDAGTQSGLTAATQWANAKRYQKRAPAGAAAVTRSWHCHPQPLKPSESQLFQQSGAASLQPSAATQTGQPELQAGNGTSSSDGSSNISAVIALQQPAQAHRSLQAQGEAAQDLGRSSAAVQRQNANTQAAPDTLLGTSGRLRDALSAALSYKQQKQSKSSGQLVVVDGASAVDEEQIKSLPPEILAARSNGNPAAPRVELGDLKSVMAPGRNRVNEDEGLMLLCPL